MQRKYVIAKDRSGNVVANAQIRIANYPGGGTATIYGEDDTGSAPIANPMLTDENGTVFFYAPNGRYIFELSGGGLEDLDREDIILFDVADAALDPEQVDGLGDLSGQNQFDVLISDGDRFQPVDLEGSVFDLRYAFRNAFTPGWIAPVSSRPGDDAPIDADQTGTGRLANFRNSGVALAYITNAGGVHFNDSANIEQALTVGANADIGGDLSVTGNAVVNGNLHVNGDEFISNTETVEVESNKIVLNSNVTGTPTLNAGLEVERGTSENVLFRWNESADRWEWSEQDGVTFHDVPSVGLDETAPGVWDFTNGLDVEGNRIAGAAFRDVGEAATNVMEVGAFGGPTGSETFYHTGNINPLESVVTNESVTGDGASVGDPVRLVNDVGIPGNDRYYGTDDGGVKGWHELPDGVDQDANYDWKGEHSFEQSIMIDGGMSEAGILWPGGSIVSQDPGTADAYIAIFGPAGSDPYIRFRGSNAADGAGVYIDRQVRIDGDLFVNGSEMLQEDTEWVTLGGDFDSGERVKVTKIGNIVTITSDGALFHTSGTSASASGVIPSRFRPNHQVRNIFSITGAYIAQVVVQPSGGFSQNYRNWGGGGSSQSNATSITAITYEVLP